MRTKVKQLLINRAPWLYTRASRGLAQCTHRSEARMLMRPKTPSSSFDSVIYFTYYRCGSQVFKKVFRGICKNLEYSPGWLDYESFMMHREPEKGNIQDRIEEFLPAFVEKGYLFGPIYHAEEKLLKHDALRSFCILRDPRDVLVSHYYSLGFAHTVTNMKAANRRREVSGMTIDDFALHPTYLDEVRNRYHIYLSYFKSEGAGFFRYEDMVRDLPGFMEKIVGRVGLSVDSSIIDSVCSQVQTHNSSEQKTSHRRSGKWGQFQTKLQEETIHRLERSLGKIIAPWSDLH